MGDFTTAGEVESVTAHEVINKNTANASGTVFRPYDCHTAGKPTL